MTARRSLFGLLASLPFVRASAPHPVSGMSPLAAMDAAWLPVQVAEPMTVTIKVEAAEMEAVIARHLARYGLIPAGPDDRRAPWGWDTLENVR